MQQRVAIARALACGPALLLMDEPFGSVDAQTREDLEDLILAVRREQDITILLVTHDIDESVYVGDRVVVLTRGPGRVRADLPVDLPAPRDQISTRELPAFVHLRASVGRLVRGQEPRPAWPARSPGRGAAAEGRADAQGWARVRLASRNAVSRSSGQVLITSSGPSQPRCAVPIP